MFDDFPHQLVTGTAAAFLRRAGGSMLESTGSRGRVQLHTDLVCRGGPAICVRGASPSLFPLSFPFPPSFPLPSLPPPFHFPYPPFLAVPSFPLPSPPSCPLSSYPLPFPPFNSPPLRSRPPVLRLGGLSGGALKLPQRVRAEPGRQTVFGEL